MSNPVTHDDVAPSTPVPRTCDIGTQSQTTAHGSSPSPRGRGLAAPTPGARGAVLWARAALWVLLSAAALGSRTQQAAAKPPTKAPEGNAPKGPLATCVVRSVEAQPQGTLDERLAPLRDKLGRPPLSAYRGFLLVEQRELPLAPGRVASVMNLPNRDLLQVRGEPSGTALRIEYEVSPPPAAPSAAIAAAGGAPAGAPAAETAGVHDAHGSKTSAPRPRVRGTRKVTAEDLVVVAGLRHGPADLLVLLTCGPLLPR